MKHKWQVFKYAYSLPHGRRWVAYNDSDSSLFATWREAITYALESARDDQEIA